MRLAGQVSLACLRRMWSCGRGMGLPSGAIPKGLARSKKCQFAAWPDCPFGCESPRSSKQIDVSIRRERLEATAARCCILYRPSTGTPESQRGQQETKAIEATKAAKPHHKAAKAAETKNRPRRAPAPHNTKTRKGRKSRKRHQNENLIAIRAPLHRRPPKPHAKNHAALFAAKRESPKKEAQPPESTKGTRAPKPAIKAAARPIAKQGPLRCRYLLPCLFA